MNWSCQLKVYTCCGKKFQSPEILKTNTTTLTLYSMLQCALFVCVEIVCIVLLKSEGEVGTNYVTSLKNLTSLKYIFTIVNCS